MPLWCFQQGGQSGCCLISSTLKEGGDACPGGGGESPRKTVRCGRASARAGRAREREGERARRETAAAGRGSTGSRDSMSPSPTRGRRGVLSLDAREEMESRLEMES
jgi:hypothetical protein